MWLLGPVYILVIMAPGTEGLETLLRELGQTLTRNTLKATFILAGDENDRDLARTAETSPSEELATIVGSQVMFKGHWDQEQKKNLGQINVLMDMPTLLMAKNGTKWLTRHTNVYVLVDGEPKIADFMDLGFYLDTTLFVVNKKGNIYELYGSGVSPKNPGGPVLDLVCDLEKDLSCNPAAGIWERREDLSGTTLIALVITTEPYSMFNQEDGTATGIFPDILSELQGILGFALEFSVPETYADLVDELSRGEADIGSVGLAITPERSEVIDYTLALDKATFKIMVKSEGRFSPNMFEAAYVFTDWAWFGFGLVSFLLLLLGFVNGVFSSQGGATKYENFKDSLATVMRAIILKGYGKSSLIRDMPGMAIFMSTMFFGVGCFAAYRGGLLSKLAVKKENFPISSLEDVLGSTSDFGTQMGATGEEFFSGAPNGTQAKLIWTEKILPNYDRVMVPTSKEGFDRVEDPEDDYAFFAPVLPGQRRPGYPCQIQEVGMAYMYNHFAMGLQKGSPLRRLFDHHLVRLAENGAIDRILTKYKDVKTSHEDCEEFSDRSLGAGAVFGLFLLLAAGAGLAAAFCAAEAGWSLVSGPTEKTEEASNGASTEELTRAKEEILAILTSVKDPRQRKALLVCMMQRECH